MLCFFVISGGDTPLRSPRTIALKERSSEAIALSSKQALLYCFCGHGRVMLFDIAVEPRRPLATLYLY